MSKPGLGAWGGDVGDAAAGVLVFAILIHRKHR